MSVSQIVKVHVNQSRKNEISRVDRSENSNDFSQ